MYKNVNVENIFYLLAYILTYLLMILKWNKEYTSKNIIVLCNRQLDFSLLHFYAFFLVSKEKKWKIAVFISRVCHFFFLSVLAAKSFLFAFGLSFFPLYIQKQ